MCRSCSFALASAACFVLAVVTYPIPAHAQTQGSSIVGVVKDSTGAVLPGVSVDLSSPALIGGVQSTTTDGSGQYRFLELRPGQYHLLFKLDGFQSLRRDDVFLSAAFTAVINVELPAASVEETLTVIGQSPVVDVRTNVSEHSINQALLEGVPNARGIFAVASMVPAMAINAPDVGGSQTHQSPRLSLHGSMDQDVNWNFDGLDVTGNVGTGGYNVTYYNQGVQEEVSVQSKALSAEIGGGGIYMNIITKDGSNKYKGELVTSFTNQSLQSRNVSDAEVALGDKAPAGVKELLDFNPVFGGPLMADKLWFVGSYRYWRNDRFVANTYDPSGQQALDQQLLMNYSGKITAQLNSSNRVSYFLDWNQKHRPNRRDLTSNYQFVATEASKYQIQGGPVMSGLWTSTLGDKLLFEAGFSALIIDWTLVQQPGTLPLTVPRNDTSLSTLTGSLETNSLDEARNRTMTAALSWFTDWHGSHKFKFGMNYNDAPYHNAYTTGGCPTDLSVQESTCGLDFTARYVNGAPNAVAVWNTPTQLTSSIVDAGAFVQDSWTLNNRVTLNLGARFEHYRGGIAAESAQAGTFVPARSTQEISDVPLWNTVVPRLAGVFDLTGDGKTALKMNASKYMQKVGISFLNTLNPMQLISEVRTWTDSNHDGIPQLSEIGPSRGTLEQGATVSLSPTLSRPYQWEGTISVERQLTHQFAVSAGYYHREYYAITQSVNTALSDASYTPVTIANPLDGTPLTVYNQLPSTVGQFKNVVQNFDSLGSHYNGFELTVDRRFANNFTFFGGYTHGLNKQCLSASTNPNTRINTCGYSTYDSPNIVNTSGLYQMPGKIGLSAHYQYKTGQPQNRTFTFTRTQVPNLTQVNENIIVAPAGMPYRYPALYVLDLRVNRRFVLSPRASIEPTIDLYNLLDCNSPFMQVNTVGPALGQVVQNVDGRTLRLGVKVEF